MLTVPQAHFPSPYYRPASPPSIARIVERENGAKIASFVYGNPEHNAGWILFLHGNGEEHGIFGPVIDAVCDAGYVALAIDSRGQGKSSLGSSALSYELMAEDAVSVLDDFGIDAAHVVGFSDGGIEALLLARDFSSRVRSALVIGANLTPEGVIDDDWNIAEAIEVLNAWAAHSWSEDIDTQLLSPTPDEAATTAKLLQLMLDEPHIAADSLSSISCPVFVLAAEFDSIREEETVAIARAIPGARLAFAPELGHVIPKEAPELVAQVLFDLLDAADA